MCDAEVKNSQDEGLGDFGSKAWMRAFTALAVKFS